MVALSPFLLCSSFIFPLLIHSLLSPFCYGLSWLYSCCMVGRQYFRNFFSSRLGSLLKALKRSWSIVSLVLYHTENHRLACFEFKSILIPSIFAAALGNSCIRRFIFRDAYVGVGLNL